MLRIHLLFVATSLMEEAYLNPPISPFNHEYTHTETDTHSDTHTHKSKLTHTHTYTHILTHTKTQHTCNIRDDDDVEALQNHFPEGEHPLEGVPNCRELSAPEGLKGKFRL